MTKKRSPHASLDIPAEVRSLRESLGLSQVEAAKLCGISQPTFHAIEHKMYVPRIATLRAIADGLGVVLNVGDAHGKIFSPRPNKPKK